MLVIGHKGIPSAAIGLWVAKEVVPHSSIISDGPHNGLTDISGDRGALRDHRCTVNSMTDESRNQIGINLRQLKAILEAANQADSDSLLLRTAPGSTDPTEVEVWLFSEEAEGIVGMIEVDPTGAVTELDE